MFHPFLSARLHPVRCSPWTLPDLVATVSAKYAFNHSFISSPISNRRTTIIMLIRRATKSNIAETIFKDFRCQNISPWHNGSNRMDRFLFASDLHLICVVAISEGRKVFLGRRVFAWWSITKGESFRLRVSPERNLKCSESSRLDGSVKSKWDRLAQIRWEKPESVILAHPSQHRDWIRIETMNYIII